MAADNLKLAVLIDGDNAESSIIDHILNEASRFGRVTIKRIYGDWTSPQMNSWKNQLNKFAIRPIQKFSYTKGKNSTDSALIIDAMDLMHSKLVDGFCIVSSDSDYTGLVHRVREEGLFVMGIGKSHTPEAFVRACENFTYTEILVPSPEPAPSKMSQKSVGDRKGFKKLPREDNEATTPKPVQKPEFTQLTSRITNKLIDVELIDNAFEMAEDEVTGLALASRLHEALKKVDPTFDIRTYGYRSFRKFLEALKPQYEVVVHEDKLTISVKRKE
jgi:hypothetical protein